MSKIKNKTELKIIEYLRENGPSFLGEFVKELKLSYTNGLKNINDLRSKGIVKHSDPPLQYEIDKDSK